MKLNKLDNTFCCLLCSAKECSFYLITKQYLIQEAYFVNNSFPKLISEYVWWNNLANIYTVSLTISLIRLYLIYLM